MKKRVVSNWRAILRLNYLIVDILAKLISILAMLFLCFEYNVFLLRMFEIKKKVLISSRIARNEKNWLHSLRARKRPS